MLHIGRQMYMYMLLQMANLGIGLKTTDSGISEKFRLKTSVSQFYYDFTR